MSVNPARRLVAVIFLATALLVAAAPGASAHGANNQPVPDAAQYLTEISGVSPAVTGLTASIDPRGEWIEVDNTTGKTLIVLGYVREPYLRIDSSGVAENQYSPTLAMNQSLFGDLNQLGESSLPAAWNVTSSGHTARWHDHRIHWMTADRPPAVQANPEVGTLIGPWTVHMTLDGQPVDISGTLSWLPLPAGISVFAIIVPLALFALFLLVLVWVLYRGRRRPKTAAGVPSAPGVGAEFSTDSTGLPQYQPPSGSGAGADPGADGGDAIAARAEIRLALARMSEEMAETRPGRSRPS